MYQKRNKILSLFCSNLRRRFYLREISRLSNTPLKTVARSLGELEEKNILTSRTEGKHKYYELNLDNIETKFLLIEVEIYRTLLFLKNYPVFKSFLKEIGPSDGIIIVYGSFSEFTATEKSDLDILVISEKKLDLPQHLLPYKIHRVDLTQNEFMLALEKGEPLIQEVLQNHIVLHGHSYFIDTLLWYYEKP